MKTQLIDNRNLFLDASEKGITVNHFDAFDAFDQYDVTVICLQDSSLWQSNHRKNDISIYQNDLSTVVQAMEAARSCRILILLPQNETYHYDWISPFGERPRYSKAVHLKDMLSGLKTIMQGLFPSEMNLVVGASVTNVGDCALKADFSLVPGIDLVFPVTLTSEANTFTMLSSNKVAYSTLEVSNTMELTTLVYAAFPANEEEAHFPDWLDQIEFLDEAEIKEDIEQANNQIMSLEESVEAKNRILGNYNKIKSILCSNGDALQETVVEILREILADDLEFIDDHKEDYRYEDGNRIFLFEVKGSRRGLRRQHISDAFHHVQKAKDDLEEFDDPRDVKGCLIFSEFIEIPPNERNPYAEDTIAIARQLDVTLISAMTFLRVYERFKEECLTGDEFLQMVLECKGELSLN